MNLESQSEITSIRGECERSGGSMTCAMFQVSIRSRQTDAEIAESIAEQMNRPDVREAIANWPREQLCRPESRTQFDAMVREASQRGTDPRSFERMTNVMRALFALCDAPTTENFRAMLRVRAETENATCKIWTYTWRETFTLQQADLWVSNSSPPVNVCGIINISELRASNADLLWTYRTRRIITNRTGVPMCSAFDEHDRTFSWRAQPATRSCDLVQFDQ